MLTKEEFCEMFRLETQDVLSREATEKMMDFILNIEKIEDMSMFSQLLK